MDIFTKLPQEDVELLNRYINSYGGGEECSSYMPMERMSYFLRYWNWNKVPFYRMFGNQFIIKKEVSFDKDKDQMEEDFDNAIRYSDRLVKDFRRTYLDTVRQLNVSYEVRAELRRFVEDVTMLIANEYDGDPFCIPGSETVDGKVLQVNKGVKAVKMLGKICKSLGIQESAYYCTHCQNYDDEISEQCRYCYNNDSPLELRDGYETFRRMHSLALNQKRVRGNLCLSIHPLDYLTISDNACCWSSCMSWIDEPGDYRLGTIEMMNSEYIVVAYMEAKESMQLFYPEGVWNNKRWRQLLVVTPEMILGNKQYPFFNDDLQGAAMAWMRDLANNYHREDKYEMKFGPYAEEALQIKNSNWNTVGNKEVYVNFRFGYMYNDIYDYRMAFISHTLDDNNRIDYYLSGPAVCTNCGEVIEKDGDCDVEPSWTICKECSGMWKCANCGDWQYGEPYYCEDSDYPYCDYCFRTETEICEVCGGHVAETEKIFIQVLDNPDEEYESYNWNFTVDTCCYCKKSDEFKDLYGEIYVKTDMYGRERQVVRLAEITDQGLNRGDLPYNLRNMLRNIRDIESYEDRVELLRENLY